MKSRKDKNTIISDLVAAAADIMEAKAEENELIAEMFEESQDPLKLRTATKLRDMNIKIKEAVQLIHENAGCWV